MFSFTRRINRTSFYIGYLGAFLSLAIFIGVISYLLSLLPNAGHLLSSGSISDFMIGILGLLVEAAVFITFFAFYFCVIRQRANDVTDKNSELITIFALFPALALVLGLIPGQNHQNKFGPVPKRGINLKP
ncbi:MAG: DUF805 domain-containing protein [Patescibacteria group bacterium]